MSRLDVPGIPRNSGAPTLARALSELLERTEEFVKATVRSPETLAMQRQHCKMLLEHLDGDLPVDQITAEMLERLVAEERHGRRQLRDGSVKECSTGTVRKRLSTLHAALKLQMRRRRLNALPLWPEVPYRYRPDRRHLASWETYLKILGALPSERALWFGLAVWTGQRKSDVERMTREDLDLDAVDDEGTPAPTMRVRSTKTKSTEGVMSACPSELARLFDARWRQLRPGQRLVKPWPHVSSQLARTCERIGLPPICANTLRHTFYTWAVASAGALTPEILEHGQWASPIIPLRTYAHAVPAKRREMMANLEAFAHAQGERRGPKRATERLGADGAGTPSAPGTPTVWRGPKVPAGGKQAGNSPELTQVDFEFFPVGAAGIEPAANGLRVRGALPPDETAGPSPWSQPGEDRNDADDRSPRRPPKRTL